jgi:hypothetical protein
MDPRHGQRLQPKSNKIYPATDAEDGASVMNVQAGLYSADEYADDSAKNKNQKIRSKIQVIGYDQNANPVVGGNANLKTMDVDDLGGKSPNN